jgi:hypothetical protein
VPRILIGEKHWTRQARELLLKGIDFSLVATGWRAGRLRNQLPRLGTAARAVKDGKRLSYREGNFSVLSMWLLLGFHELFFQALARGMFVSWAEADAALLIGFTRLAPDTDRVIGPWSSR